MMSTYAKKQGQAYRLFSRSRYTQLKRLHPAMRQAQTVKMIISEWQNMQMEQRNMQEVKPTPMKMDEQLKNMKQFKTTTHKKMEEEEKNKEEKMKMILQNKKALFKKEKKIQKQPQNPRQSQYIQFYRTQFGLLNKEHPKWSISQISRIINLKWKQLKMRMLAKKDNRQERPKRLMKLSGRMQFKMLKRPQGYSDTQIMTSWKRFPLQTKMLWQNQLNFPKSMPIQVCTMILPQSTSEIPKMQSLYQLMHSQ